MSTLPSAPHFSVIIPVYNRANALAAAIGSVLAQSCQDFEIVVVDDGSRDDPQSALSQFGDPRIRFIRQDNRGGGAARNAAIDAAHGRFIAPLDSDDIFLPHHLERMKNLLDGTSNTAGYARILVDRGEGRIFVKPPRAIRDGEDMGEYLLCARGFVPTITVVVEREMAKRVRYHENLRAAEDTDFAIRLALAGCRFAMADEPGAVWKDIADPGRTSAGVAASRTARFALWLEQMKPEMTARAWRGARGWAYAKMLARDGRKFAALRLYLIALICGCYAPKLAAVVFLQVFLNAAQYRRLADSVIAWLHPGLDDGDENAPLSSLKKSVITRRALLAAGLGGVIAPVFAQAYSGLRDLAARKRLIFGTAAATYELKDADFPPLLAREAAMLVPEYEMKRHVVEPAPGRYDFSGIDTLMAFAQAHGMAFRGHPLVWYNANPPWLEEAVSGSRDEKLLNGYVTALAGRYRGRMHSLDVVNEALAQDGSGLRSCFWLKAFGPSYIDMAFHAARAADPQALLVYNDYGCEPGGTAGDTMRANCLKLLDGMLARGVPVQALGMQGHLSAFGPKVDQTKLRNFLSEIAARKLALLVTELDVDDEGGAWDIAGRDRAVADEAARFLDVVLDSANLQAVLTWGLSDRYADPPDSLHLKMMGWRDRKFPYDSSLTAKPLRAALARAFSGHKAA